MNDQSPPRGRFHMTRRRAILGGSFVGGALLVGYVGTHPAEVGGTILSGGGRDPEPSAFGSFIRVAPDGWVTIVNKEQEMGQGIHAGLAAVVAEELDADWDRVRVIQARANFRAYGGQLTAGSRSLSNNWDTMRKAGAAARSMFVDAAALRWQVPRRLIEVRDGVVSHAASGRSATFAELLDEASRRTPPQSPTLKRPADYRLIGTDRVRRKDTLAKTAGTQVYTQDVQRPGLLIAMVAHAPRFGGKLARYDVRDARKVKGVVDAFAIDTGVAVIAENSWAARRGREALRVEWDDSEAEKRSSADLVRFYRDTAGGHTDVEPTDFAMKGEQADAPLSGDVADFSFDFPYLCHAPMETLDCVAQVKGWNVSITSGSHLPTVDQVQAARIALTLPGKVDLEVLAAGGSFGRRGLMSSDYLVETVRIARRSAERPVKLMWTREDEMMSGFFRPMSHHRVSVQLRRDGFPDRWRFRSVCQPLLPIGDNPQAVEGIVDSPYLSTASTVEGKLYSPSVPVPVSFWRSVGNAHTAMVMEHVVDQLARRAGRDPAAYRRALYRRAGETRYVTVLDELCRRAGWGGPIEAGWARGMAIHKTFGSIIGQVAEVSLDDGRPLVRRVTAVVDCGVAVSPDQIAAQMEGGIGFGLSAALFGAMTLRNGVVEQTNFDKHPILRMNEMPRVETYIIPSSNPPTGMGECGVPPIMPAVANAMLALTGRATSTLPFMAGTQMVNSAASLSRAVA